MALELASAMVIAALSFGYRSDFDLSVFDEGLLLYGSVRIGDGDVPYRDFWTTYAPGSYYLLGWVFRLFGTSVWVARLVWLGLYITVAVQTMLFARLLGGRPTGWLAFALAVSATIQVDAHFGYNVVPAVAAILSSLLVCALGGPAFVCGMLIGCAAVFRHDFGAYGALAAAAGFLSRDGVSDWLRVRLAGFVCGIAVTALPMYGIPAWTAGVHAIADQLIVFPATELSAYYSLPWVPGGVWFLLPATAVVTALAVSAREVVSGRSYFTAEQRVVAVPLMLLALGFFYYASIRLDRVHSWPVMIATIPLIAAAPLISHSVNTRRRLATGVAGIIGLYGIFAAAIVVKKMQTPVIPLTTARGIGMTIPAAAAPYNDLLIAVQAATTPVERIFSGVIRHDAIWNNDVLLYFLTERPAATPYHELNRGLMANERVQAEIVETLEKQSVRIIVLLDKVSDEPNRSAVSNGITLLDDYIRDHYRLAGTFGNYRLLSRRADRN